MHQMKKIILVVVALIIGQATFAQTFTDISSWVHKGPFKGATGIYETGRLDVIVPHPSYNGSTNKTIFAGGSNGGLWKTTDGGLSWTNIPTNFMRYSGIGDMAFSSDGLYLYIADRIASGTWGDRGSGVYKYKLSSGTWTQTAAFVTTKAERLKNNHIKIHPSDTNYIYLATNAGLWVTANAGGSWGSLPKAAGDFENIAFVPNAAATGGYDIYISGMNTIMKSSDKGTTFSAIPTPSPNNPFTTYTSPYFDMAYGGLDVDGTSKIIYFYGWVSSPSAKYILYKYKIPTSGSPTMTFLLQDLSVYPRYSEIDRLCVVGDKNSVYVGGTNLVKYKLSNNTVYDPVPNPNGTDVALSAGNFPTYYSPSGNVYATQMHPDLHDIKIFDNGTIRKIFVAHDGGFSEDTYTLTGTAGVYTNSWVYRNNGLHIATLGGFSGSATNVDVYATGEQDTKGFVFKEDMSKIVSFEVEPHMVLLDRLNKKNDSLQDVFRVYHNGSLHDVEYEAAIVDFNKIPATISSTTIDLFDCDPNPPFTPNNTYSTKHSPQSKVFVQDPARADRIYALSGGFWQWDEATYKFGAKYKLGKFYNDPDPLKKDHPYQRVNSIAVSRNDKNKVYLASDGDTDIFTSHIYRYTGTNIDDSWDGHNDTNWDYITPDFSAPQFGFSLPLSALAKITFHSLQVSNWDPTKLWVIASGVDNYTSMEGHADIKVLKYENGVWINYSENIPLNEVAVTMVYEQGSNDGIYLATDRNIYYRNSFMGQWELFNRNSNSVPHIFTRQMEINYKENTLRAGTWGRGIWKTNLNCLNAGIDPVVPTTCNNCNSASNYFWQASSIALNNTTLTNYKQIARALTTIDILPETTITPANSNVYYEFFIHGCGGLNGNSYKVYQNPSISTNSGEEEEEREMLNSISAYPNPNNGSFTLNTENGEKKDISVFNTLGKIIYQKNNVSEKTIDITISNSPKGVYFVRVVCNGRTETIKIINQ
jgi:hypothetical protein